MFDIELKYKKEVYMEKILKNKEIIVFYLLIISFSFLWVWRVNTMSIGENYIVSVEQNLKLNV